MGRVVYGPKAVRLLGMPRRTNPHAPFKMEALPRSKLNANSGLYRGPDILSKPVPDFLMYIDQDARLDL